MARARDLGYSVAEVPISFVDRIYGDSTSGEGEMKAGETYSSIDVGISEEKGILIYSLRSEPPTGTSRPCHSGSAITPRVALHQCTRQ